MPLSAYVGLVSDPIIKVIEQELFTYKLNLLLTANNKDTAFITMS
jgi:energy-converting hydrogenase Eha subunit E